MRLLSMLYWQLLPGICICCRQDSHRPIDICRHCEEALPYLDRENPCQSCALPQIECALPQIECALPQIECALPQGCAPAHQKDHETTRTACAACTIKPKPWTSMTAIFIYENTVSHWIQLCKYHGALVEQRVSATLMAQSLASTAKTVDLIIPVPLSKRRLWQRGHNQSLGLARIISRHLGISLHHSSLKRIRHTPAQQRLSRSRRLKNLKGAFVACPTVAGKTVALVDDVVTTQATVVEATLALLSAGAKEVHVWALARVLR